MTTQTAGEIDVFASPAPKAGVVEPDTDPKPKQDPAPKRKINTYVEKVKPWHFFVVLVVIAAIWIFAPKLIRSNSSLSQGQQSSTQTAQPQYGSYERSKAAPLDEPQRPVPVSQQVEMIQLKSELETFSKIASEFQGQVRELQGQVLELQAKVAVLESRPSDTSNKPKERIQAARNQPAVSPSNTSKALSGYSVNTVYADQAWVVHDQRTFVVQVGDTFDDIRVLRIDPVSRQVVTNLGVIR